MFSEPVWSPGKVIGKACTPAITSGPLLSGVMAVVRGTPSGVPVFTSRFSSGRPTRAQLPPLSAWSRSGWSLNLFGETTMNGSIAVTTQQPFDKLDSLPLFSVNPGVPVEDALERAANLMLYV